MQLKLTRSQRTSMMGKTVFHLDVRADISEAEQALIRKYKLGKDNIYSSEALKQLATGASKHIDAGNELIDSSAGAAIGSTLKGYALGIASRFALKITADDLVKGKAIECKDLAEMLDAEEAVTNACKNLKAYLEMAETFDGRELVVEI